MKYSRLKIVFSMVWLLFTISLVSWWFIFALRNLNSEDMTEAARHYRMLFFEGSALIVSVLVGGIVMIFLSVKDDQQHKRLKYFFSNFNHDIKTSITRLRLQADILTEQNEVKNNRVLQRLLNDISKLDLQLENSLLLTHVDEAIFLNENIFLPDLFESVQIEFDDMKFKIQGQGYVTADSRALRSIIRNIFENSRRHGKATAVEIQVVNESSGRVKIIIQDNGSGTARDINNLGFAILPSSENSGTGIGLYLARHLIQKMHGSIHFFSRASAGFRSEIVLKGHSA
jgi:signal transduction histidine kinase